MELAFDGRRQSFKLPLPAAALRRQPVVHRLPVEIAQSTGAVPTAGRPWVATVMLGAGGGQRMRRSSSVPWIEHGAPKQR